MAEKKELIGPDLARGISFSKVADGNMLQGHVKRKPILVARRGDGYFAIGAMCTHYGAPLATGIIVDDTVRCPWHHACFSLRTGEALRAPALDSVICWKVETRDGKLFVRDKIAPEEVLMATVLGPQVGAYLHRLHERNGVLFHLQQSVVSIDERKVTLKDGHTIDADLVVIGIGVKPLIDLAERAGIKTDRGVSVNEHLETSIPGIFAAGDIARWPDPLTGDNIRVEHWVVAERQGQTAARNILGRRERFEAVPFFWTSQFDFTLNYVGHAEKWDKLDLDGSIEDHDCKLSFQRAGKTLAVATVGRDRESLENEVAMERSSRRV